MGTSLRRKDYTQAAERALRNALWHNSISAAEFFGFPKSAMHIYARIGVQNPQAVDTARLCGLFPYGQAEVEAVEGGLDMDKPNGEGKTVIANASLTVSFTMEPTEGA